MNANTEIPQFPLCKCGCEKRTRFTSSNYLPGHDAKHKGQVARQVISTGDRELIKRLPSPALQAQALELVAKWTTKGKVPGGPKLAKAEAPVEDSTQYEIKIGRWTYPVKKHGASYLYNTKRDGSGEWSTMEPDTAKRVYKVGEDLI